MDQIAELNCDGYAIGGLAVGEPAEVMYDIIEAVEPRMFYYVEGTVAEILPYLAVIDCGGVGYACATTNQTLSRLKKGERARLYTFLYVREDIFDLYGFSAQKELNSFKMLLNISGVGPKAALAILSVSTPEQLAMYEDKTLICKECGNEFVFTAGEQEFYAERGFQNEPQRCKLRFCLRT